MIEATVALVVTAMGLALLAGIGSNMQKQMVAKQEIDQFEWERFVSLLQNERQHFALVKKPGENVENIYLYSRKAKKDYIVHYESERDKVIMETASGGYMPLLYRVSSFRAIKQDKTIKITAQIDQRTYQTTFSLPLQKVDYETKRNIAEFSTIDVSFGDCCFLCAIVRTPAPAIDISTAKHVLSCAYLSCVSPKT